MDGISRPAAAADIVTSDAIRPNREPEVVHQHIPKSCVTAHANRLRFAAPSFVPRSRGGVAELCASPVVRE